MERWSFNVFWKQLFLLPAVSTLQEKLSYTYSNIVSTALAHIKCVFLHKLAFFSQPRLSLKP